MTSFSDPLAYFAHAPFSAADMHVFEVWAFQTPEEAAAHVRGERGLFTELEDWLDDFPDKFFARRGAGLFHVACPTDEYASLFELRWGEHVGERWSPRSSGRLS